MRVRLVFVAALVLVAASPAQACMSSGPGGYSSGLVWDNKPGTIPDGAFALKVGEFRLPPESGIMIAEVREGPRTMIGKRYRFVPMNLDSCVGFGSREGYIVVWNKPINVPESGSTHTAFEIIDYRPSIVNEFVRNLFGGSQWRYPGNPSERYVLPQ